MKTKATKNKKNTPDIIFKDVNKTYYLCKNDLARLKALIMPKKIGKKIALENINLTINKGDKIAFVGKNGAGKSTLLGMLCGSVIPTSGKITINRNVSSILTVGAGMEQDFTGIQNIYIIGAILGLSKKQIQPHIDEIVKFSGLEEYIDLELKRYSAGMIAKLATSILLHLNLQILLVDEALSVGDIEYNNKFKDKINELSIKNDLTLMIVSHNEETILNLCNRLIIIHDSKIYFDGNVKEGFKKYHNLIGVKENANKISKKNKSKKA